MCDWFYHAVCLPASGQLDDDEHDRLLEDCWGIYLFLFTSLLYFLYVKYWCASFSFQLWFYVYFPKVGSTRVLPLTFPRWELRKGDGPLRDVYGQFFKRIWNTRVEDLCLKSLNFNISLGCCKIMNLINILQMDFRPWAKIPHHISTRETSLTGL